MPMASREETGFALLVREFILQKGLNLEKFAKMLQFPLHHLKNMMRDPSYITLESTEAFLRQLKLYFEKDRAFTDFKTTLYSSIRFVDLSGLNVNRKKEILALIQIARKYPLVNKATLIHMWKGNAG